MNYVMITKINNEIKEVELNKKNILTPYNNEKLVNLLNFNDYIIDEKHIKVTIRFIRDIFIKFKFNTKLNKILLILNSKNLEKDVMKLFNYININIDNIIKNFPKERKEDIKKAITSCINCNKIIIIKIITRELINIYCKNIIDTLPKEKLNKIYFMYLRNEKISFITKELNINFNENYKDLYEKAIITKLNSVYEKKLPHLCWMNCQNIDNCDKMDDVLTETIYKYDFIKCGYQIINSKVGEDGNIINTIDKFYVIDCDNYKKKTRKK